MFAGLSLQEAKSSKHLPSKFMNVTIKTTSNVFKLIYFFTVPNHPKISYSPAILLNKK